MENEKKSSRLGVRLSAVMVAVLLVVCMAVPAFADEVYTVYGKWTFNDTLEEPTFVSVGSSLDTIAEVSFTYYRPPIEQYWDATSIAVARGTEGFMLWYDNFAAYSGSWKNEGYRVVDFGSSPQAVSGDFYNWLLSNATPPPPPDPLESVGTGLVVVMDWVGSVVSAVVSGPLSGLLILLAIPVAITLLLVAFVVIRRIIWGA